MELRFNKRKKTYSFPMHVWIHHDSELLMGYGWIEASDEKIGSGTVDLLRYHSSWDWLMPVIEKIEMTIFYPKDIPLNSARFRFMIHTKFVSMEGFSAGYPANKMIINTPTPKILTAWITVVDFIEWYNKQLK